MIAIIYIIVATYSFASFKYHCDKIFYKEKHSKLN